MKRTLGIVFFFCMFSAALFADFVINPTIGYSNLLEVSSDDGEGIHNEYVMPTKFSANNFVMGLDLGYVGKSGFTFMFNNDLALFKKVNLKGSYFSSGKNLGDAEITVKTKGVFWDGSLLFGYTFKPVDSLFISLTSGLNVGFGLADIKEVKATILNKEFEYKNVKDLSFLPFSFGVPINISTSYYFTKNIGLGLTLMDVIGVQDFSIGKAERNTEIPSYLDFSPMRGFFNNFTIKIGPTFKF